MAAYWTELAGVLQRAPAHSATAAAEKGAAEKLREEVAEWMRGQEQVCSKLQDQLEQADAGMVSMTSLVSRLVYLTAVAETRTAVDSPLGPPPEQQHP